MVRKVGAAVFLSVGGAGYPSNTMSPGSMPTSVPSGIVIIQPFGNNTPTLQTGQTGQRSRSIGRTVICNGAQKFSPNGESLIVTPCTLLS